MTRSTVLLLQYDLPRQLASQNPTNILVIPEPEPEPGQSNDPELI